MRRITSGDSYIEIENRKFMFFEVEQVPCFGNYEVTDPEEKELLLEAWRKEIDLPPIAVYLRNYQSAFPKA